MPQTATSKRPVVYRQLEVFLSSQPDGRGSGHVVEIIEQALDGYRLVIAHQDPDQGDAHHPAPGRGDWPVMWIETRIVFSFLESSSFSSSSWCSAFDFEDEFEDDDEHDVPGYQALNPWLVRTPDRKWNRAGIKV